MSEKKQWAVRILAGGLLGAAILLPLGWLFNGMVNGGLLSSRLMGYWISPDLVWLTGSAPLALAIQLALYFALGAAVGVSTLPFADEGKPLLLCSLAHFAVTAALFSLLVRLCGWAWDDRILPVYLALLAAVYVLIWLGRWVGWYAELIQLRAGLGLAPGPAPLKWRETLPYLPFALLICTLLPALLWWVDRSFVIDVPVFSAVLYPFLLLPIAGVSSGASLGRRHGFCPLYPAACLLFPLPLALLPYSSSLPLFCLIAAGTALAGNAAGALRRITSK